jgi:hypothetical protein
MEAQRHDHPETWWLTLLTNGPGSCVATRAISRLRQGKHKPGPCNRRSRRPR